MSNNRSSASTPPSDTPRQGRVKAALLSGLVLPGLGQLIQKRYTMATLFISLCLLCLYILFTEMAAEINAASARIVASGSTDMMQIQSEAYAIANNLQTPFFLGTFYFLIAVWLGSIIEIFKPLTK